MRGLTLVTAFILAGGCSALADPLPTDACVTDPQRMQATPTCAARTQAAHAPKDVVILLPNPTTLNDVHGGRGPDPHARELREIALATSIGHQEKAEIVSRQLRKFGVSSEAVQDAVDQAQVHASSLRVAKRRFFVLEHDRPDVEPGWENSQ